MKKILCILASLLAIVPVYSQTDILSVGATSASDYASLAKQAAQQAMLTRSYEYFDAACSNILKAVELQPTNQEYLVAATVYLDGKTRFTPKKEVDGFKYAEQAARLSKGKNGQAYFQVAKALDYVGYPSKEYLYSQFALKTGGLSTEEQDLARRLVSRMAPRKTILWKTLDAGEIRREPSGLAMGKAFFYFPVPASMCLNQISEYLVKGALKWDTVETSDETFLRIWPGTSGEIEIKITISRFEGGRKVIFEDHTRPLPPEVAAFTNSTSFINSSAPEIQAAAQTLTRSNWVETAKAIAKFVNQKWNYVATGISSQSSTTVLSSRTGMCVDKANLCVALARANGIPARMVLGCEACVENGKFTGKSVGHMWAEAFIPGTGWCEFVADADCFGWIPWFCLRFYWQDTELFHEKKWDSASAAPLDLAISAPYVNQEMERIKYILWFGMSDECIGKIGNEWNMIKYW